MATESKLGVALRLMVEFNAEFSQRLDRERTATDLENLIRSMAELDRITDSIGEVKTEAENLYNRVRHSHIPDVMAIRGVTNLTVENVGQCYLQEDTQVTQQDKDAVKQWLIDNGFEDLIVESVNAQTFAKFIRDRFKERKPIPFDLVTMRTTKRAVIKTSGLKSKE